MEMLIFGHGGMPLLVFPTSMGRFFEYEDRGMIALHRQQYEHGAMQAFCPDSVDSESWYNKCATPPTACAVTWLTKATSSTKWCR